MIKTWHRPTGTIPGLYNDIMQQPHTMVAGSTGSGKSVLVNGLIHSILYYAPCEKQLVLIDPKRIELSAYKDTPHCIAYYNAPETAAAGLQWLLTVMENRYKAMEKTGARLYNGPDIYCIIDEYIDIIKTKPTAKVAENALVRLSAMARAAKIHIILCTQRPTADIITGVIKANFTVKLALRCNSRRESQNILDCSGAELLPDYGYGLYQAPQYRQPVQVTIPYYSDPDIESMVQWWTAQNRKSLLQKLFA